MASKVEIEVRGEPVPPSFSVQEYVEDVIVNGHKNDYINFNFDQLLADMPKAMNSFGNDIIAKAILCHCYGEGLAKHFRNWIRSQMHEEDELPCGGASIGEDEEGLSD